MLFLAAMALFLVLFATAALATANFIPPYYGSNYADNHDNLVSFIFTILLETLILLYCSRQIIGVAMAGTTKVMVADTKDRTMAMQLATEDTMWRDTVLMATPMDIHITTMRALRAMKIPSMTMVPELLQAAASHSGFGKQHDISTYGSEKAGYANGGHSDGWHNAAHDVVHSAHKPY
uniref:Copper transporter n=1 Tax=Heterorhabditis bacteriophora TaxID=37862 RepID=A0A1I7X0R7_HETBA